MKNLFNGMADLYVENIQKNNWLDIAVKFDLGECPLQRRPVFIESRGQMDGGKKWVVLMHEWNLGKDGFWYREPLPSWRSDKFLANTRFETKEMALEAYSLFLKYKREHILTMDGKSRINL